MDPQTGLCLGCFRTLAEISGWSGLSHAGRSRIIAALAERRASFSSAHRLPDPGNHPPKS